MRSSKSLKKQWQRAEVKPGDTVLEDARPNDIIILVMGPPGVGKSTFINTAAGKSLTKVGHGLESCTVAMQHAIFPYPYNPSRRIVFVDTPGFDDTYQDDAEILRRIAVWLARSYNDDVKLSGIIYLHDISQPRVVGGASRKNFDMMEKLCGADASQNVILATTKWGNVKADVAARREHQLREYWKEMIDQGCELTRFTGSRESAWDIVDSTTRKPLLESLQIQNELVDLGRYIPETAAGNTLRASLKELVAAHKKTIIELRNTKENSDDVQLRLKDNEDRIRTLLDQIQTLQVPASRRILGFIGVR
ncbi:hypothetical protein BV22DRAFT_1011392 [Leucogyrophana mollusca]|uniref:Uncharacterized protein n=1 Tax=Leucogyrophana mollusca TaxID=85980 RepID=A0ACB8BI44_9AGAM|nr:hypothetical protein BV22DRAFT_1011392 [Leucogyrophana mollusca]